MFPTYAIMPLDMSAERKNNIIRLIAFILILVLLVFLLSTAMSELYLKKKPYIAGRLRCVIEVMNERPDTLDLITLGDSEAYSSFNPMTVWNEAGIPSFLLGHSAQFIGETYSELKKALKTQTPKVVLIETHGLIAEGNLAENLGEFVKDELKTLFPIFVYHDKWKELLTGDDKDDPNFFKGFKIKTQSMPYQGDELLQNNGSNASVSSASRFYMERIMKLCEEKGAKLMLYSAPSPVNYNAATHEALTAYASEIGVPYSDLNAENDKIGIDWKTDSIDEGDHLNVNGADKVTRFLINFIKENESMEDRSKDQNYKDWDALFEKYLAMKEELSNTR